MTQITHCDWLPEWAIWSHLAHSGLPAETHKKNFPQSHIIKLLLTKFVWSRWSFFFCEFMDLDFVSVHKRAKKELSQYPAILTSHLVNNPYIIHKVFKNCFMLSVRISSYGCTREVWRAQKGRKNY